MNCVVILAFGASLLGTQFSAAQGTPDFSGIFLRTGTRTGKGPFEPAGPRILEVKQTAEEVLVSAFENGETALVHYRFESKKTGDIQAKLKEGKLILKAKSEPQVLSAAMYQPASHIQEEDWSLSADGRSLTLERKYFDATTGADTYVREPNLQASQAAAELAAQSRICEHPLPSLMRRQYEWMRQNEKKPATMDENGVELGSASFDQITFCTFYTAVLSGGFFKGLTKKQEAAPLTFQKREKTLTEYAGDLTLEVAPHSWPCGGEIGNWVPVGPRQIDPQQRLRFMVRWLGPVQKDLGEVQSALRQEPWRENYPFEVFYRMRVPADEIPLEDTLEVVIFSEDSKQLACIRGHI